MNDWGIDVISEVKAESIVVIMMYLIYDIDSRLLNFHGITADWIDRLDEKLNKQQIVVIS